MCLMSSERLPVTDVPLPGFDAEYEVGDGVGSLLALQALNVEFNGARLCGSVVSDRVGHSIYVNYSSYRITRRLYCHIGFNISATML